MRIRNRRCAHNYRLETRGSSLVRNVQLSKVKPLTWRISLPFTETILSLHELQKEKPPSRGKLEHTRKHSDKSQGDLRCNVVLLCHAETIMNRRNRSLYLVYPLSSSVLITEQGHHTSRLQDPSITKHCKPVPKHRQPITQTIPPHSPHTNPQTSGDAEYKCTNERIEKILSCC